MGQIVQEIARTTSEIELLLNVEDDLLFLKPSIDQWSVLECITHLVLVEENILNTVLVPGRVVEGPVQTWEASKLMHILVNKRDVKFDAPAAFVPNGEFLDASSAFGRLLSVRNEVVRLLLDERGLFDGSLIMHPRLGLMTRMDWVWFLVAHSDRHVRQMRDILGFLSQV